MKNMIVAHRGARLVAPENTKAAFDAALASPVDGLELDVQLTRDEIPVLYHDRTLRKICGSRRRIADYTLAELEGIDWGGWFDASFAGCAIMRFDELLCRYSTRTRLLIEIKSTGKARAILIAARVLELIRQKVALELLPYLYILSFDQEVLKFVHRQRPDLQLILNLENSILPAGPLLFSQSLVAVGVAISKLNSNFVSAVHAKQLKIMTWACNNEAQAKKGTALGADILLTDDPAWLIGWLGRHTS